MTHELNIFGRNGMRVFACRFIQTPNYKVTTHTTSLRMIELSSQWNSGDYWRLMSGTRLEK